MASPQTIQPVFPDVHHKMSKKIAQLTKVIYHLNTKNEDHEAEMQAAADFHRFDVERILKDAAKKIGRFKEQLEVRRGEIDAETRLKRLEEKYEREKRECLAEFASLRAAADERETTLNREWKRRTDPMREELRGLRRRVQILVDNFEAETRRLKAESGARERNSTDALQKLRESKEEELAELVRSSNEKYQKMLAEQLNQQDDLREAFEREQVRLKAEHEQLVGRQRAELDGEHAAELGDARREHSKELRRLQESFAVKQKVVEDDMQQLQTRYEAAVAEKSDLELNLAAVRKRLENTEADLDQLRASAEQSALGAESSEKELRARVNELVDSLAARDLSNMELDSRSRELRENLAEVTRQRDSVRLSRSELEHTLKRERELLNAQLRSTQDQLETARSHSAQLEKQLKSASSRADDLEVSLIAAKEDAFANAEELRDRLRGLHIELESTKTAHQEEQTRWGNNLRELEEALQSAKKDARERLDDVSTAAKVKADELQRANEEFMSNIRKLETQVKVGEAALAALEEQRLSDLDSLARTLDKKMEEAEEQHRANLAEKTSRWEEEKRRISERMLHATTSAQAETEELQARNSELAKKLQGLDQTLVASKTEEKKLVALTGALKAQIADLRRELHDSKTEAAALLEKQLMMTNEAWENKLAERLRKLEDSSREAVNQAEKSKRKQIDDYRAELKRQLDDSLSKADERLRLVETETEARLRKASEEEKRLREELGKSKRDSEEALRRLQVEAAKDSDALRERMDEALSKMSAEKEAKFLSEMDKLRKQHDAERKALATQAARAKSDALAQLEAEVRREESQTHAERLREVRSQFDTERRLLQETSKREKERLEASLKQMSAKFEKEMIELRRSFETQCELRANAVSTLEQRRKEIETLEDRIKDLEVTYEQTIERLAVDASARESLLTQEHKDALENEQQMNSRQRKTMQEEFHDMQNSLEMKISSLHGEIEALEARYLARESRPEDVMKIKELSDEVRMKDALVEKHKEDMAYFKRELLNREEMYNRRFGKSPTVGVMQVLKPTKQDSRGSLSNAPQR